MHTTQNTSAPIWLGTQKEAFPHANLFFTREFVYLFLKEPTESVVPLKSWHYELEGKYFVKSRNWIFSHQAFTQSHFPFPWCQGGKVKCTTQKSTVEQKMQSSLMHSLSEKPRMWKALNHGWPCSKTELC